MARTNQRSPIIPLAYAIRSSPQWNEVFGTDRRISIERSCRGRRWITHKSGDAGGLILDLDLTSLQNLDCTKPPCEEMFEPERTYKGWRDKVLSSILEGRQNV